MEILRKSLTFRVPPFKVARGHWHRHESVGYLWLSVFHSKNQPIPYHFGDKWRYL